MKDEQPKKTELAQWIERDDAFSSDKRGLYKLGAYEGFHKAIEVLEAYRERQQGIIQELGVGSFEHAAIRMNAIFDSIIELKHFAGIK